MPTPGSLRSLPAARAGSPAAPCRPCLSLRSSVACGSSGWQVPSAFGVTLRAPVSREGKGSRARRRTQWGDTPPSPPRAAPDWASSDDETVACCPVPALLPLPSRVPLAGPRHGLRPQHNAGPFAWRLRFGPAFVSAPRPGLCPGPRAQPSQPQRRPGSLTLLLGRLLWSLTLKYQIKGQIESLALAWRARGTSQGQTRRLRPKQKKPALLLSALHAADCCLPRLRRSRPPGYLADTVSARTPNTVFGGNKVEMPRLTLDR